MPKKGTYLRVPGILFIKLEMLYDLFTESFNLFTAVSKMLYYVYFILII